MTRVTAILLAAGLSKRMNGPNKLLLPFGEGTVIQQTYDALSQSDADEIIVVTGRDQKQVIEQLALRTPDRFIHNGLFKQGMTSSIQQGVKQATGEGYMICLGDMPWLSKDHYNDLLAYFRQQLSTNDRSIIVTTANGKRGNPVIFSKVYKGDILNHTEPDGCRQLVQANMNFINEFISEDKAYTSDIDTQEDYDRLKG